MGKDQMIQYTESAKEQMQTLQSEYIERLERIIKERKYVPGETIIEITASDIEQASHYVRIVPPQRMQTTKFMLVSYSILGVLLTIGGLLYPQLEDLFSDSPSRAAIVLMGLMLTFFGILGYWRIRHREKTFQPLDRIDRFRE